MGKQRQEHYVNVFQKLEPDAQRALKDIYHQAHKDGREMGRHVVMAMVASVKYPDLFKFTLSNIVVRLMLKRFQLDGDWRKALHMQEVLDDFHLALDAFVKDDKPGSKVFHLHLLERSQTDVVQDLYAFKGKAGLSLDRAKRAGRSR